MKAAHAIESLTDDAFGWYLAGFADGEGCFTFSEKRSRRKDGSLRLRWESVFVITLRADDSPILAAMHKRLGCGSLTIACRSGVANPVSRWVVNSVGELANVVIPHFDKFPLMAKKSFDFTIWKAATLYLWSMSLRRKGQWLRGQRLATDEDTGYLRGLREQLTAVRKFDELAPAQSG